MAQTINHPTLGPIQFPDGMSDSDIVSAIKRLESNATPPAPVQAQPALKPQSPWMPNVDPNKVATVQGANMAPQFAQMGREMALETGAATAGQAAGALMGPAAIVAIPTFGGIAALSANIANQKMRKDQKDINYGEAVASFISGAIPGATMAKAEGTGIIKMIRPVTKEVVANLAAAETQSMIDNGRALTPKESAAVAAMSLAGSGIARTLDDGAALKALNAERAANAPQQKFIQEAVGDGYQIWPSASKFSAPRAFVERAANPKKMQLEMAAHNFDKAVGDVRSELGMFSNGVPMPITKESIDSIRGEYNKVYSEIGQKTGMEDAVSDLTKLRHDADINWKRFESADARAEFDVAQRYKDAFTSLSDKAAELEKRVLDKADQVDPGLSKKFLDTRKQYAKSYAIEFALDPVMGFEPAKLARWQKLRAGQELTDKMGTIANMAEKFPDIMMGPKGIYSLQGALRDQALQVPHILGPMLRPGLLNQTVQNAAASQPYRLRFDMPNAYTSPMSEAALQASRAAGRQVPVGTYLSSQQAN